MLNIPPHMVMPHSQHQQGIPVLMTNGRRQARFADILHTQVGLLRLLLRFAFHFCPVCSCLSLVLSKKLVNIIAALLLGITAEV